MSIKAMLDKRGGGSSLLHGSDVPAGTKSITIEVVHVRESPPGFDAPFIIEFKKAISGKTQWAVNKSNAKLLADLFGDDEAKLVGQKIKLDIVPKRNPKTGEIVPSLVVSPRR